MEARGPEVRPQAEPGHRTSFLGLWRDSLPTPSTSLGVRPGSWSTQGPRGPPQGHPIAGVRGGRLGAGLEDTCPQVHSSSSSHNGARRKRPECPQTSERTHKTWPLHTVEHYSSLKRKDASHEAGAKSEEGSPIPAKARALKAKQAAMKGVHGHEEKSARHPPSEGPRCRPVAAQIPSEKRPQEEPP